MKIPLWISIPAIAAGLVLWIKHLGEVLNLEADAPTATIDKRSAPKSATSEDDIQYAPNPNWKTESQRGCPSDLSLPCPPPEFERPSAPAQRIKTQCWEYGDDCPGARCGKIRKLSEKELYPEECEALQPRQTKSRDIRATADYSFWMPERWTLLQRSRR